ncbi:MAG: cytidylyltransferase domain-containing protein [Promethearchaeota archaeon]
MSTNSEKKKVGVIVQARMGSTRLPGKVLKILYKNETILDILIKRLKFSKNTDDIIIATTPDVKNQAIINVANIHNVASFIGNEKNVLKRYFEAAKKYKLDIIIRVTADCPFVDPLVLDDMIQFYLSKNYDYIRNVDDTTNFPRGFEIEIFNFDVLEKVFRLAKTKPEKEHVTYFIYTHPKLFSLYSYNLEDLKKIKDLRLTIDEEDDLEVCREVIKLVLKKQKSLKFSVYDIIKIIELNPKLIEINKNVQQKKI